MSVDAYTKVVLSVIAGTLALLVMRSFQNPPPVSAQQVHVQHVIIDDLGPRFANGGLPITSSFSGPQHVILEGIGPLVATQGIPVSSTSNNPLHQTGSWQYSISDCSANTLNSQGLLGWELVSPWMSYAHSFTYDSRSGQGVISGLVAEEKNNSTAAQSAVCYFKKPSHI
jgi:hypothetical protein